MESRNPLAAREHVTGSSQTCPVAGPGPSVVALTIGPDHETSTESSGALFGCPNLISELLNHIIK